ncbi:Aste57867_7661 [Aphanomyces stellatus]|uniref:Aste57867_7661 protein n=1 Tax=Aphanomyces stellatus TaxID=120398 RepID=A0A485KIL2_9STRA|nr:hypothetical protein As57867_007633 [Aphanomyces stellatus]VFT84566.1 Aste57867_7661 [Aphanomyces stellatus]
MDHYTYTFVPNDEQLPNSEWHLQQHGFGWSIIERVTNSITLVRYKKFIYTPVTTSGLASLDDIGQMFGLSAKENQSHELYVQQIRSAAHNDAVQAYSTLLLQFT